MSVFYKFTSVTKLSCHDCMCKGSYKIPWLYCTRVGTL